MKEDRNEGKEGREEGKEGGKEGSRRMEAKQGKR